MSALRKILKHRCKALWNNIISFQKLTKRSPNISTDLFLDMMNDLIEKVISEVGASPERMTIDEKIEVVRKLNEQGVLTMKGSVSEIAKQIDDI